MPDADIFLEKRVHPRLSAKIHVKYRLLEDQKEIESVLELRKNEKTTQAADLSQGGMYIVAARPLEMGNILRLEIGLPGRRDPLPAFAEVVWANETGGGLRFVAMKEEDKGFLRAYLNNSSIAT